MAVDAYRSCRLYWSPRGWSTRAKKVAEEAEEKKEAGQTKIIQPAHPNGREKINEEKGNRFAEISITF